MNKIILILLCCCLCCSLCSTVAAIEKTSIGINFAKGDLKSYNSLYPLECEITVDGVTKTFEYHPSVDECIFWRKDIHDCKYINLEKYYDHFDKIRIKFKLERKFDICLSRIVVNKFWIDVTDYIKSTKSNENKFEFRIKMDYVWIKADGFNMYDLNGKLLKHYDIYY